MAYEIAEKLVEYCTRRELRIVTAESCTAGLIAAAITDVPGSSAVLDRGFVTYSNVAKSEMLDIDPDTIEEHGAVSEQVVTAMAHGAILQSHADISVAVSGIAGPGGGTPDKPVGLVYIAGAGRFGKATCEEHFFPGNRTNIRTATVQKALEMLYDIACKV